MSASSRFIVDIWAGICCCHISPPCVPMAGPIITGSPNDQSGNFDQGRLTDMTIGYCGHPGTIVTAAPHVLCNSLGKARIGELVVGCNIGSLVTGLATHEVGSGGGAGTGSFPSRTIEFQGEEITLTEVDFGNADDEPDIDDGLNIMPPIPLDEFGNPTRPPTPEEIIRSAELDASPTTTEEIDATSVPNIDQLGVDCEDVTSRPPDDYELSPNFTLGDLSSQAVLSLTPIREQLGLTYADLVCNHKGWAVNVGEPLSTQFGRDNMLITSGFRAGNQTSQHNKSQAADIQYPLLTNTQVFNIAVWIKENVSYDQMILEYGGQKPWVHLSFNRAGNRPSSAPNKFGTRVSPGNYVWGQLRNMS
ncbi:MAG: hypothetical protein ACTSX1_09360 [Candidatus Heimdallarchaeaceae archaeon]